MTAVSIADSTVYVGYNGDGWITSASTELRSVAVDCYDSGAVRATCIDGATTQYGYRQNGYGAISDVTDAIGQHIGYEYDSRGRLLRMTFHGLAGDASSALGYDIWGRAYELTGYDGRGKRLSFDILGQVSGIEYFDAGGVASASLLATRDGNGHVTRIESYCGLGCQDIADYMYDAEGRLSAQSGVGYGMLGYGYDRAGRLERLTWPTADVDQTALDHYATQRVAYDRAGRVTHVFGDEDVQAAYTWNVADELTAQALGNGAVVSFEYDNDYGDLEALTNLSSTAANVATFGYSYDNDGYIESVHYTNAASDTTNVVSEQTELWYRLPSRSPLRSSHSPASRLT